MSCKYKRTITIDVENNEDGTYDAYISTGTCSGDQYSKFLQMKLEKILRI